MGVTVRDVARHAGVSPMTVSRVVNSARPVAAETRERVQASIAELGYVPNGLARGLTSRKTGALGVIVPDFANPFFTLIEPMLAPGTTVQPGGSVQAHIQYKKPVSGGTQVATLRIETNDTDYGPPANKIVRLYSQSPLDQIPTAVLTGCLPDNAACPTGGSTGTMSVRLSTITGTPKTVVVSGKNSVDPGNATPPGIREWKFQLIRKPTGANATITGNDAYSTTDKQTVTLDPMLTGNYQVYLFVKDDAGQQSVFNRLDISVLP